MSEVLISRKLLEICLDEFLKLTKEYRERQEAGLMVFAMDGAEVAIKALKDKMDRFPAVDAVPVVRCRECKHWSGRNDKPGEVTAIGYCNHPNHHIIPLMPDWFCADGK